MTEQVPDWTPCPECIQGKHGNCDGSAWSNALDMPVECVCHGVLHDEALLGGRV